nr:hypothetical protein [Tanacetum cinerariifolium]
MAYSSTSSNSEVSIDSIYSSSYLKNSKTLKEQNEQLLKDLRTSKINAITYKIGLESVEARLLVYKNNESIYEEDIKVLKRKIYLREVAITELRRKLVLAQKQKDEIQLTVENFENLSICLSKLIDCQIVDKCKIGLGYNVGPPPYTGNFMPLKPDLSFSGLEEFVNEPIVSEPTVKKPVVETSEAKASADKPKVVRKNFGSPLIEDWISDSEDEAESKPKTKKKTIKPSFAKIDFVKSKEQVTSHRKTNVKQGNQNRLNTHNPRGNQRNWNNIMSQKLGSNFEMFNNACYNYAKKTRPCPKKNMVPRAVLMKSGLTIVNIARPINAAHLKSTENAAKSKTYFSKIVHSTIKRPFDKKTIFTNSNVNQKVNNVKDKTVNTARPKAVVNAVLGYNSYAIKASACWVCKPKTKVIDLVSKHNSASITLKKFDYVDAQGRFKVRKDFSGRETSLFSTMMVQDLEEMGEGNLKERSLRYLSLVNQQSMLQMRLSMRRWMTVWKRAATTATSLDVEHDRCNLFKTQSKATPNEPGSQGTSSGGGPRCQETMRKTVAQTRVKKLERRKRTRSHGHKRLYKVRLSARVESSEDEGLGEEDASKQERIADIDANEDIYLVNVHNDEDMFGVKNLHGEEVFVAQQDENVVEKEVDDAQHIKPKAKAKAIVFYVPEESTTTTTTTTLTIAKSKSQDKGKANMIEEHVKLKKKYQIQLDKEVALKLQAELQAEFDKEQRLAGKRAQQEEEANIALIESWDDIQAKINASYQLAERLQAKEQQELNDEEKATLFMQLLKKKRKFFAANRAEEKRNKPPTQAQQRKIMCTYLKNMKGKKLIDLKIKSFDSVQKMLHIYKAGVAIDAIPLAVKPSSIVDWKIIKEGKKTYYQIIRADGSSKIYLIFSHILKDFDREDVKTLWKLVKAMYGSIRPDEDFKRVLWGDLKVMFDPHVEDVV